MSHAADVARYLAFSLLAAAPASFAENLQTVIENCNDCHGAGGVSEWRDMPSIAGLSEFYHADQLYVFRDEDRPCSTSKYRRGDTSRAAISMCEVAADLGDEIIDAIGAHYAGLPFVAAEQDFDAALAAAGKSIHDRDCGVCHGDGGSNAEDDAGILAGQWMGYLESTFAEYRGNEREQPGTMKKKLDALSDDDVKALLHYYASLR